MCGVSWYLSFVAVFSFQMQKGGRFGIRKSVNFTTALRKRRTTNPDHDFQTTRMARIKTVPTKAQKAAAAASAKTSRASRSRLGGTAAKAGFTRHNPKTHPHDYHIAMQRDQVDYARKYSWFS